MKKSINELNLERQEVLKKLEELDSEINKAEADKRVENYNFLCGNEWTEEVSEIGLGRMVSKVHMLLHTESDYTPPFLGGVLNRVSFNFYLGRIAEDLRVLEELDDLKANDTVNHPSHYTSGGIEVIDFMKAKSSEEEFKGYLRLNVIKYLSRANLKGKTVEDLKKASWYLNRLIGELEDE